MDVGLGTEIVLKMHNAFECHFKYNSEYYPV